MTWPRVPLKDVAPAESSCMQFQPEEKVWLLTLDQIESHTAALSINA
jgi:transcriptional antiterminator Rof (Rho-off)